MASIAERVRGWIDPYSIPQVLRARVESVHAETSDVATITLRPDRAFHDAEHRAGQFVNVGVEIDGRIITRTFSISSAPKKNGCIAITVKANPEGRVSKKLVFETKPGDSLRIEIPRGDFVLPRTMPTRMLFVTGGSGITPVMSMLRSLGKDAKKLDIIHVHYARTLEDVIFRDELEAFGSIIVKTREVGHAHRWGLGPQTPQSPHPAALRSAGFGELVPDWKTRETWACGPESLLASIESVFAFADRSASLHLERFRARVIPLSKDARSTSGHVRFGLSKKDVETHGMSLLEIAESAGIHAPHGCRMGICHSCDTKMISGCVRDMRTGEKTNEPGTRIQLCVCRAEGDVEIDL